MEIRIIRIIIPLIIILTSFFLVAGEEISFYKSESILSQDSVKFSDIILVPENPERFSLDLFFKIKNFRSESTFVNYNCEHVDKSFGSRIVCDFGENVSGRVSLYYETGDLIEKINGKLIYKNDYKVPIKTLKLVITTKLEEGLIMVSDDNDLGLNPYLPIDGTKGSDGRRIYVFWERENIERGDGISTHVVFESLDKNTIDNGVFILFGVLVIIIIIIFTGIYYKKHSGIKSAIQVLKDDERKIIEILQSSGGEAKQRQIQLEGDFSKATLSRLIKNLEERGLVRAERLGRTNRIYLNKDLGKSKKKEN